MSVMKIGDIIMLDNDMVFTVLDNLTHEDKNFLYAVQAPDGLEDTIDSKDVKIAILQESIDEASEEVFVEQVTDAELLETLTQEFARGMGME